MEAGWRSCHPAEGAAVDGDSVDGSAGDGDVASIINGKRERYRGAMRGTRHPNQKLSNDFNG
jgi:hypothetical protein